MWWNSQSYLKLVHIMCTFYQEEGQSEELVNLCQQALQYNPLDEAINQLLDKPIKDIKSLLNQMQRKSKGLTGIPHNKIPIPEW